MNFNASSMSHKNAAIKGVHRVMAHRVIVDNSSDSIGGVSAKTAASNVTSNNNAPNILLDDKVKSRTLVVPTKDHHIPMFPLLQHHPPPSSKGNSEKVKDLEMDKVKLLNHVKQAEESIKSYR
eukprot:gene12638-16843_t